MQIWCYLLLLVSLLMPLELQGVSDINPEQCERPGLLSCYVSFACLSPSSIHFLLGRPHPLHPGAFELVCSCLWLSWIRGYQTPEAPSSYISLEDSKIRTQLEGLSQRHQILVCQDVLRVT